MSATEMEYMEDLDEPQFPGHGRYLMGAPPLSPPEKIVGTPDWSMAVANRFRAALLDYNASHPDEIALLTRLSEAFEAGRAAGIQQERTERTLGIGRYRKDS